MSPLVSVAITTWNSAATLAQCLDSLCAHDYAPLEIIVVDNASNDATRDILARYSDRVRVMLMDTNTGFSAAQNLALRRSRGEWVLSLNPDVRLGRGFIATLVQAGESGSRIGTVCGKLLRWAPGTSNEFTSIIDSTGICFLRNLRHLDRGAEQFDSGQYDSQEFVFGATGAAALYRRTLIDDISVAGEFFDEMFFAYREDADVAWRAQVMGWQCLYVPAATAWHVRRVTPERRERLPLLINWHSVKNRFVMRRKNMSAWLYLRLCPYFIVRDAVVIGYALLRDWRLLSALIYPWQHRRAIRLKRTWIQERRRVADTELIAWFRKDLRDQAGAPEGAQQGQRYSASE